MRRPDFRGSRVPLRSLRAAKFSPLDRGARSNGVLRIQRFTVRAARRPMRRFGHAARQTAPIGSTPVENLPGRFTP